MLQLHCNGVQRLSLFHGFHRLLLFCTSSSTIQSHSLANYFVESLGFSEQQALACSAKSNLSRLRSGAKNFSDVDSIQKADMIVSFLKQNGFDQSQIRQMVFNEPRILRCKIDKTLKPKLEFLQGQGLSGCSLIKFVAENPAILLRSLESGIIPATQTLRKVLGNDLNLCGLFKSSKYDMISAIADNLALNVDLLQNYGIPIELIRKHVVQQPWPFVRTTKAFKNMLIRVEEKLGIPRNSPMFLYGVEMTSSVSDELLDSKCQVFKSFGWTESDIGEMIRRNPNSLKFSESRIRNSLEFFMNELGYKPADISTRPFLLTCSLEKRMIPRHRVLQVLKSKGLVREDLQLYSTAIMSDTSFEKKFVLPYKEVHEVYAEGTGRPLQPLTQGKEDTHSQR